ncbi:MAG: hypothetical protein B7X55_13605 [Rhodobacterales bacterium 34-62-10]|nr:MAG: hypothetical protein B7X55_13605 [Rhodobacterales bacterium 34-62-10]
MVGIGGGVAYLWAMRQTLTIARIAPFAQTVTLCLGLSATVMFGATPAMAEPRDFTWIPAEISLPDDMEVVIDRSIGSANRILSFTTDAAVDELADTWRAALEKGPYQVQPAAEGMDQRLIAFSGGRVQNGQISFMRGADSTAT